MPRVLCFGLGYTAQAFVKRLGPEWTVIATTRDGHGGTLRFDRRYKLPGDVFDGVTHILVSIPPEDAGDPAIDTHTGEIAALPDLRWLGYLSTTGVYGNRNGGWVDETSDLRPTGLRSERRVAAESAWLKLWLQRHLPVHIFRLAGIYGPGRSALDALRAGIAKRIDSPGQVFSRIHVDDIASVLLASIVRPRPGAIYNVCDDEPASAADVVAHAAELLGVAPPPLAPLDAANLSPMAKSFYADSKRVSNVLIKHELGVELAYPNYRVGLAAILKDGG